MATTTTSTMGCHCQHKRKLPKLIQTSTKISLVVLAVTRTIGRSSGLRPGVKNARSTNFYSAAMVAWAAVHAGQCQVCKHFLHKDLAVEWVNCLITANGKGRREQLTSLRKNFWAQQVITTQQWGNHFTGKERRTHREISRKVLTMRIWHAKVFVQHTI